MNKSHEHQFAVTGRRGEAWLLHCVVCKGDFELTVAMPMHRYENGPFGYCKHCGGSLGDGQHLIGKTH